MRTLHAACACLAGVVIQAAVVSAPSACAREGPGWITGSSPGHPKSDYIVGVGVSDETGSRAEKLSTARARAREEIAAAVRVRIRSKLFDATTERTAGGEPVCYSVIRNISKSSVDLEIEGIETPRTWYDTKSGIAHALAVLNRAQAGGLAVARMDRLISAAARELEQSKQLEEDSVREALGCAFRAKAMLLKARRHDTVARVLGRERFRGPDEPELVEVLGRIDRLVAREESRSLDAAVTALAYRVTRAVDPDLKVLVDRFTYRDTKFAGPFSLFLRQGLDAKLAAVGGGKVIDRRRTAGAVAVQAASENPNAPEAFARAAEADAVLYGNYQELAGDVIVRAHLSGIDGERLASAELVVKRSLLDEAGLDLVPPNYAKLREELSFLSSPEDLRPTGLHIGVWTDRGDGGVYRGGEKMYVYLKATGDCYVRLVYHQADGTDVQIFPNTWAENRRIAAGRVYRIPDDDDAFEFKVCEPYGGEILKAFASTEPFPRIRGQELASGLRVFAGSTRDVTRRMRGISVQAKAAEYAEAMCQITTMAGAGE